MSTKKIIEAVLFVAQDPVAPSELAQLLEEPTSTVEQVLGELAQEYGARGSGIVLREVAGGWRLTTHPDAAAHLERFIADQYGSRLSQAALETLAIIAYRQPIARSAIADIRGVSADGVVRTLVGRGLIEEVGREEGAGQAVLYGTTQPFLERLGLRSLQDLPSLQDFMPDVEEVDLMESGLSPGV